MSTSDYTVQTRHLRKRRFQDAKRAWKRIHGTLLPCQEAGYMRYRSVLGFGGFGVVQKWDVNKPDGTFDRTVAVKGLVNSWEPSRIRALKREVWWMKQFRGSEHLVQLVDLDPKLTGALEINREASDDIDPMIAMEELGRGSLALLIKRMLHMRKANSDLPEEFRAMEYIPNRALWHIFLCLTRACIGMAYPSSTREANSDGSIRESMHNIPPGVEPRKIVHCDIDIQNTFIADPEPSMRDGPTAIPAEPGSEHIYNPVIKIADYGCMVEWDDNWDTQTKLESLWGKRSYKAPEQFSDMALVPGAMGVHTNIYQIGGIMHDLITLAPVSFYNRDKFTRRVVNEGMSFETYGWRLLNGDDYEIEGDWGNVDIELRELVVGCMSHDPAWRPGLAQLEDLITNRIAQLEREAEQLRMDTRDTPWTHVPGLAQPVPHINSDASYNQRVSSWNVEPDSILQKFYKDYFIEAWGDPDKYSPYWEAMTLTPEERRVIWS